MPLCMGVGDIVLDGVATPLPKRGRSPSHQFSAHIYCGQTAGWIKMPLGVEVGLSPGHFVLDGDPAPCSKKGQTPNFRPISIVAKRLDASRYFLPMSVVVKRLYVSGYHLVRTIQSQPYNFTMIACKT